ncbi:MAG: hypothetical protein EHM27_03345 [Deltaproteobacteria bacterium]|nr:MAG: hypothetical protein EHM27_17385 [Deltaproteobacteria bacterium]RPJ42267.1 MAG: hypothetical protein EHM27_03345 [Deltaproteobacteria bacterium]
MKERPGGINFCLDGFAVHNHLERNQVFFYRHGNSLLFKSLSRPPSFPFPLLPFCPFSLFPVSPSLFPFPFALSPFTPFPMPYALCSMHLVQRPLSGPFSKARSRPRFDTSP